MLTRKYNPNSARPRIFDGVAEAKLITLACGPAPEGHAKWSLRLLPTPGSPTSICSRASMPTWPSPIDQRLGTPEIPAIGSTRRRICGFTGSFPLRPARLLAPLHGSDWDAPALGGFYNQAFDGSVSLPVAGYNYNSGWISFCWRDLHPLEWRLKAIPVILKHSLHD